jgi:hypothetical protein
VQFTLKIERKKKWESIFSYGESLSSKYKFTEDDVTNFFRRELKNCRDHRETAGEKQLPWADSTMKLWRSF